MTMYHTSPIGDSGYTEKEERLFLHAFLHALLWSSVAIDPETGEDIEGMECETLAVSTENALHCEALNWLGDNKALLDAAMEVDWYSIEQAGHDLALTCNRHGAGFWDRGLGDVGDKLTEQAHLFGGVDLYIGDDGYVYKG